jgi:hypothetical protein
MNKQTAIEAATIGGVHRKLSMARQVFHELQLKKSGKNTFAGYDYFELGDFLIPALGVFDQVGLGATISFTRELATMTIVDLDNVTDTITITSPMGSAALKGCHEVQNIGAVETYQRRYLWVAALEIVEHDALDKTTGKKGAEPEVEAGPINDDQLGVLQGYASAGVIDAQRFCKFFQIADLRKLPADKYEEAVRMAKAKAEKQPEMAK